MKNMFSVYYNGLFERKLILQTDDRQKAMDMCQNHNKTMTPECLKAGIGNMFFIDEEKRFKIDVKK